MATAPAPAPDRLTDQSHWDGLHRGGNDRGRLRQLARRVLGDDRFAYLYHGGYVHHVVQDALLGPHLAPGSSIVEIGSAPGLDLAKLATRFRCDPWGIDYSDDGAAANRATFTRFGFDPDHVIHGDFFSDALIDAHRGRFDVVTSNGFIEHFRDVRPVVARHVALLRPGGLLSIGIPNFGGVNGALTRFFNPALIDAHNLDIMAKAPFAALFDDFGLTPIHCGYVGLFSFGIIDAPAGTLKHKLARVGKALQLPLDLAQRRLFGARTPEVPWASPYLYFVGKLG